MTSYIAFLIVYLLVGFAYSNATYNGQPGCQTEQEIKVKTYRNYHEKTQYFECVALGQPGVLRHCPIAHGFLDPAKKCVHLSMWYWTPIVAPPSVPGSIPPA